MIEKFASLMTTRSTAAAGPISNSKPTKAMEARSMWLPPEEAVKNECWIVRRERRTHEARRKHRLHLPPALATAVKAILGTSAFTRFTGVTARLCALKKPSNCREYSHDRSFHRPRIGSPGRHNGSTSPKV